MKHRSIDHTSHTSRTLQCAGNCSKCAASTSGRRIGFVTLSESDFTAERGDLIATTKTTFISLGETLSRSKRTAGTCTRRLKSRMIFRKINERPCCSPPFDSLIGIGSNEAADRSRPVLYEAVDTIPRSPYNSGCPAKKQGSLSVRKTQARTCASNRARTRTRCILRRLRDPLSAIFSVEIAGSVETDKR